ncbi:unnamed protein product [Albugo candida]|uniref:Uncharacterized protein n=1 Tax=Albugo candida TaxID=65357 RepID=A0A024FU53_9STRA|nr:unnamed protein product [Albugo candida]|eukprot:CCI10655.1 unnamed protein product [Albugo candida]
MEEAPSEIISTKICETPDSNRNTVCRDEVIDTTISRRGLPKGMITILPKKSYIFSRMIWLQKRSWFLKGLCISSTIRFLCCEQLLSSNAAFDQAFDFLVG